jgi:hypothetical protein
MPWSHRVCSTVYHVHSCNVQRVPPCNQCMQSIPTIARLQCNRTVSVHIRILQSLGGGGGGGGAALRIEVVVVVVVDVYR